MRIMLAALAALALSACVGPAVPPTRGTGAPPVHRPAPSRASPSAAPIVPMAEDFADEPMQADRPSIRSVRPSPPSPLLSPASGETARVQGLRAGPAVADLGITLSEARAALGAFRISCPSLVRRTDSSGLTRAADWQDACSAANGWSGDARDFFARYFEAGVVGDGTAFATGYYEPEIRGSLTRGAGYEVPIYRRPADLIDVDLGLFADDLRGRKIRGQAADGQLRPYPDRAAIVGGALAGRGLELAWAADEVEFFFLQVQGSGRLRLPDGRVLRIAYDSQNGRAYTGIGALMRDRGLLGPGEQSMQGIMAWLRAHPQESRAIMNENKSFVFFRPLNGPGPIGAMGLPVTGRASVAADPAFVPLGAPVFLSLDRPEATGLWVAQDTGGAIKGANRFDTFWGAGEAARRIAGGMSGRGAAWLLLPVGTIARLGGAGGDGPARR